MITWITKDDDIYTIQPQCMENKTNESENENIWQIYYDNEVCYNTKMKKIIPTNFQKDN